jgi:UDP-N-acetylglucosamine 2-epimerase (non-hydrolysing)
MKTIFIIIGTRPEAIKLFPVILSLKEKGCKVLVCLSGQHTTPVIPILSTFGITIDYQIDPIEVDRTLSDLSSKIFSDLPPMLEDAKPDTVVVQGDTTTAATASLCAFYCGIQVAHVEAGLRTDNKFDPYPEEVNRRVISEIASIHFAPTETAYWAVRGKGDVYLSGNTGIDALRLVSRDTKPIMDTDLVLITMHRRENWDHFEKICSALDNLARFYPGISFWFIMHPNPELHRKVRFYLESSPIKLVPPVDYIDFVSMLNSSKYIITDSGGLQEEAAFLGKFAFVMRDTTERMESVQNRLSILVTPDNLIEIVSTTDTNIQPSLIYGSGYASDIVAGALS